MSRKNVIKVFIYMVSGIRVQKEADRIGSYKAGKLEGLKARKLPGFLASWLPSLQAMSYQLRAILPDT